MAGAGEPPRLYWKIRGLCFAATLSPLTQLLLRCIERLNPHVLFRGGVNISGKFRPTSKTGSIFRNAKCINSSCLKSVSVLRFEFDINLLSPQDAL